MHRFLALFALLLLTAATALAGDTRVDAIELEGPVTPVMARYLERAIEEAARDDAVLLVRLNTPGGKLDAMDRMVQLMGRSPVPIVVWVTPRSAMAASAGTFVVLAGHLAAMAPGTSIGAASPVDQSGRDLEATLEKKTKNVMVTQIRGLAARRGARAEAWAERAVRNADAATAEEALDLGLIDAVAADTGELFEKLEGRSAEISGEFVPLHLRGAAIRELEMSSLERFLQSMADPTLAYVLLMLGLNGVLFELTNPGAVVPGVIGGVCLLLCFLSLGMLDVNYAGLLLVALGFLLFVLDVKASTHGALTVGGILALVSGATMLFDSPTEVVSRPVIFTVAGATGAFALFAMTAAARARRRQPLTGKEGLVGARGTSRARLDPAGMVMVDGELWRATAVDGPIDAGAPVVVTAVDGIELVVRRAEGGASCPTSW